LFSLKEYYKALKPVGYDVKIAMCDTSKMLFTLLDDESHSDLMGMCLLNRGRLQFNRQSADRQEDITTFSDRVAG
jgi:hypothetical protein